MPAIIKRTCTLTVLLIGIFTVPAWTAPAPSATPVDLKSERAAYIEKGRAESQRFRASLKTMTPAERAKAIRAYREARYNDNKAFNEEVFQKRRAFLAQQIAANTTLTQDQKSALMGFIDRQHAELVALKNQMHIEGMAYFDKITADTAMPEAAKKKALKDFLTAQKEKAKAFHDRQVEARKRELAKITPPARTAAKK
jgi:hypothetical protein